jgi:hypothetical protein
MMKCRYCFTFGAALDHSGYVFPISDWRMPCLVDAAPHCTFDSVKGYWYVTGEQCKYVVDNAILGPEYDNWYSFFFFFFSISKAKITYILK